VKASEPKRRVGPDAAALLRRVAGVAIVTVAVARCLIEFPFLLVFDVDPVVDPTPLSGLGRGGSLLLDALLLGAAAAGCVAEGLLARRRLEWLPWLLAFLPVPVVLWHGAADLGDLAGGATWAAAAAAGVTLAHLGRDRALRIVLVALLAAAIVPVGVRGCAQSAVEVGGVTIRGPEYAQTLRQFQEKREEFFRERGWEPDSPGARLYERRLRRGDPRGWFTTANIFASLMAFGTVIFAGLLRQRPTGLFAAAAVLCAAGLLAAGSKGAFLAAAAGVALRLAPSLGDPLRRMVARRGGPLALACVAAALGAIALRGVLVPEWFLGDRSLLFRWHYQVGAARILADHPLLGVGPDGFQEAYAAVRPPRSPEEVRSAHSMLADWLATLGGGGLGWGALAAVGVWRAGRRLAPVPEAPLGAPLPPRSRWPLVAAAAVAVAGLVPAIAAEAARLDTFSEEVLRVAGVAGYVAAAAILGAALSLAGSEALEASLAAAAITLVVHGQIEMTFFEPGSVVWMACALGLAAPLRVRPGPAAAGALLGAILLAVACWLAAGPAASASRATAQMIAAAEAVARPPRPTPQELTERREAAAEALRRAWERQSPRDHRVIEAAARQLLRAGVESQGPRRAALIERAVAAAERAVAEHGRPTSLRLSAEAHRLLALQTKAAEHRDAAIERAQSLAAADPAGVGPWVFLGDLLREAARPLEAADAYRRALRNDANFELDPMKQLPPAQRERLVRLIEESGH
jgi:hypothetical protein